MKRSIFFLISAIFLTLLFDGWTKEYASYHFGLGGSQKIFSFFGFKCELTYVENRGSAWGLFSDSPIFLSAARIGIILFAIIAALRSKHGLALLAFSFIAAGGIANLWGIFFGPGAVVDMVHLSFKSFSYPVFNVADVVICLGITLLIIYLIGYERDHKKST